MSEQNRTGRTFIDPNMKKQSVAIDKDGNVVELPKQPRKTLDDLVKRRNQMMGRS